MRQVMIGAKQVANFMSKAVLLVCKAIPLHHRKRRLLRCQQALCLAADSRCVVCIDDHQDEIHFLHLPHSMDESERPFNA